MPSSEAKRNNKNTATTTTPTTTTPTPTTEQTSDLKTMYGFVETPTWLVDIMLQLAELPARMDSPFRVLDCGAGRGSIGCRLLDKVPDPNLRVDMVELSEELCAELKIRALPHSGRARIHHADFLNNEEDTNKATNRKLYDLVIANPPYNVGGLIKTPTNTTLKKSNDGTIMWRKFVHRSIELTKPGGRLVLLIPSNWMRGRNNDIYEALMKEKCRPIAIRCMNNTETNQAFKMLAQTPTCIVSVTRLPLSLAKKPSTPLFLSDRSTWVAVPPSMVSSGIGLPTSHATIITKLYLYIHGVGRKSMARYIEKTTLPYKANQPTADGAYQNVRTCMMLPPPPQQSTAAISGQEKEQSTSTKRLYGMANVEENNIKGTRKKVPSIVYEQTPEPTKYAYTGPKLILAHKMYGFPYLDISGEVGLNSADGYVLFPHETDQEPKAVEDLKDQDSNLQFLKEAQRILCSPLAILVFESFRYRMRFLEREAFEYLPHTYDESLDAALDSDDWAEVDRFADSLGFHLDPDRMVITTTDHIMKV